MISKSLDLQKQLPVKLFALSRSIAQLIQQKGGHLLLVGGTVRDLLIDKNPRELDAEVRGLTSEQLIECLLPDYPTDQVGKSFGVLKLKGLPMEIALPRTEIKTGNGHKAFSVEINPHLPFKNAASRRDFTINAIGLDPLTGNLEDPFQGQKDLKRRTLRHVSSSFSEDPLRVLRGMQLSARLSLKSTPETICLCKKVELEGLASERIFEEWKKLILLGDSISDGLNFLKQSNWLRFFPEFQALVDCPQDPKWHPEGDVWVHTLHCMDAFAKNRTGEKWEDLVVGFAVLCHDLGKPSTTKIGADGRIRSPKHEPLGEEPTRNFLAKLTNQNDLIDQVVPLVRRHLAPRTFYNDHSSDGAIRRLARQVKRIDRLVRVAAADIAGRPPRKDAFPEGPWLLKRADELKVKNSAPQPIIMGRHLINRGMKPSPDFSVILAKCFEAQLDGEFSNERDGIEFLGTILK